MELKDIYVEASILITTLLREEERAQGHVLTRALEESIQARVTGITLEGFALAYIKILEEGRKGGSMRDFPRMVQYFIKRGLSASRARVAAAATIRSWMREGLPTVKSNRFSTTGTRKGAINTVINGTKLENRMNILFDTEIERRFRSTKSETI